jgi:hypothetical protein
MTERYNECSGIEGYQPYGAPMYVRFERSSCLLFPWSKSTFHHMIIAYTVALRTGMLRYCCSPFHDDLPRCVGPSPHCVENRTVWCGGEPFPRLRYDGEKYLYYIPPSEEKGSVYSRPIPERVVSEFIPIPPGLRSCSALFHRTS